MSNRFDELLTEIEEAEAIAPEWLDRLREASKGSPLRKERDDAIERADRAEARTKEMETATLASTLSTLGVKVKLDNLRLPDDLEVSDPEKVKEWAVEAGLVEAAPDVPNDEIEGHEAIATASVGADGLRAGVLTPTTVAGWTHEAKREFMRDHPQQWEALKRGEEVSDLALSQ